MTVILIILCLRTMLRNTNLRDNITIYTYDSKIYMNAGNENDLGLELAKISEYDKAIIDYNNAIKIVPCEEIFYSLVYAYEKIGDLQNAKKYLYKAIQAKRCKLEVKTIS